MNTVLIVEDSVSLRVAIVLDFESLGWRVLQARDVDGAERHIAREGPPDAALVDIMLPPGQNREGIDLAKSLRARFKDLPIVVMTNRGEPSVRGEAEQFATKFFEKRDTGAIVDEVVRLVEARRGAR